MDFQFWGEKVHHMEGKSTSFVSLEHPDNFLRIKLTFGDHFFLALAQESYNMSNSLAW